MAALGEFAGKQSFASLGVDSLVYLSYMEFRRSGGSILLPAMNATSMGDSTLVTLYQVADTSDQFFCQLANGQWISLDYTTGLNWLTLDPDPSKAIKISFSGTQQNRVWKVDIGNGPQQVYYSVEQAAPLLTLNEASGSGRSFAVTITTASLSLIRKSGGKQVNLKSVDFEGQDLSYIDFTQADFTKANLNGANCDNATLIQAIMSKIVWGSATANNAVLDHADFTGAILTDAAWGKPKSAQAVNLSSVNAERAVLGDSDTALPMEKSNFTGANFASADLSKVNLTQATLSGARFDHCTFNGAILDNANLGVVSENGK